MLRKKLVAVFPLPFDYRFSTFTCSLPLTIAAATNFYMRRHTLQPELYLASEVATCTCCVLLFLLAVFAPWIDERLSSSVLLYADHALHTWFFLSIVAPLCLSTELLSKGLQTMPASVFWLLIGTLGTWKTLFPQHPLPLFVHEKFVTSVLGVPILVVLNKMFFPVAPVQSLVFWGILGGISHFVLMSIFGCVFNVVTPAHLVLATPTFYHRFIDSQIAFLAPFAKPFKNSIKNLPKISVTTVVSILACAYAHTSADLLMEISYPVLCVQYLILVTYSFSVAFLCEKLNFTTSSIREEQDVAEQIESQLRSMAEHLHDVEHFNDIPTVCYCVREGIQDVLPEATAAFVVLCTGAGASKLEDFIEIFGPQANDREGMTVYFTSTAIPLSTKMALRTSAIQDSYLAGFGDIFSDFRAEYTSGRVIVAPLEGIGTLNIVFNTKRKIAITPYHFLKRTAELVGSTIKTVRSLKFSQERSELLYDLLPEFVVRRIEAETKRKESMVANGTSSPDAHRLRSKSAAPTFPAAADSAAAAVNGGDGAPSGHPSELDEGAMFIRRPSDRVAADRCSGTNVSRFQREFLEQRLNSHERSGSASPTLADSNVGLDGRAYGLPPASTCAADVQLRKRTARPETSDKDLPSGPHKSWERDSVDGVFSGPSTGRSSAIHVIHQGAAAESPALQDRPTDGTSSPASSRDRDRLSIRGLNGGNSQGALSAQSGPAAFAERKKLDVLSLTEVHESVSIVILDVVGYTRMSAMTDPRSTMELLHTIYSQFDQIVLDRGLLKLDVVGDAYLACAGLETPLPPKEHARQAISLGLELIDSLDQTVFNGQKVQCRVGICTGPVAAGVLGKHRLKFTVMGDTVNTASRCEATGMPGCVHFTQSTLQAAELPPNHPALTFREVEMKGKGRQKTWLLPVDRGEEIFHFFELTEQLTKRLSKQVEESDCQPVEY